MQRIMLRTVVLLFVGVLPLSAGVALLVGEPFGAFGFFNPTGHAAVYLSRVCAESPVELRRCRPGEIGVVISRYRRVAGYDWIAMPPLPFLYAVSEAENVPASTDIREVERLRDSYRRRHLRELAPDAPDGEAPKGDWTQLVGAAYNRNIYGFFLETAPEDDDRLIRHLNGRHNRKRFHLLYRNCVDFARGIINFYYPGALGRSVIADLGISTPKHAAKSLVKYCRRRPDLQLSHFVIPQIPGGRPSTKARGVAESLIRSKKYLVPLAVFQPWVAATAAAAYLTSGRFNSTRQPHTVCEPGGLADCVSTEADAVDSGG